MVLPIVLQSLLQLSGQILLFLLNTPTPLLLILLHLHLSLQVQAHSTFHLTPAPFNLTIARSLSTCKAEWELANDSEIFDIENSGKASQE